MRIARFDGARFDVDQTKPYRRCNGAARPELDLHQARRSRRTYRVGVPWLGYTYGSCDPGQPREFYVHRSKMRPAAAIEGEGLTGVVQNRDPIFGPEKRCHHASNRCDWHIERL